MDFVNGLVRPLVTAALVATIIYMAVVLNDTASRAAVVTLGVSIASFWFGQRTGEKAAEVAEKVAAAAVANGEVKPL